MAAGLDNTITNEEKSRRIRARKARHWLLGIASFIIIAWFLFAQSPLTPRLVLPPLARLLGVGVSADSVSIGVNGVVAFERLRFTVTSDGSTGPASVLAEAKQATGKLKLSSLIRGRIRISELVLVDPTVRVSQSTQSGKLNLASIDVSSAAGSTSSTSGPPDLGEVPTILVSGGAVLLGEHDASSFTLLRRVDVDGKIEPTSTPARGFEFRFHEVKAHDAPSDDPSLDLHGTFTSDGLALDLTGFSLDAWPARVLPGPLRAQVSSLELAGRISRATLRYGFKGIPTARLDLEDVAITLPVTGEAAAGTLPGDASQERLRMTKTTGSIQLSDQGLQAKISGRIEDLPYTADLTTTSADPDGPFTLVLSSSGYELGKNPPFRRFLNETVKERLRDFGNPTGTTTTIATITRGPKTDSGPGDITTKGQLRIENGVAAFHKFPYEFGKISAVLNFTENAIEIESLRGTAKSGATIFAHGTISPLTDGAEVKLDIVTKNVPIDEALEAAMKPGERLAVQRMFSREDYARIREMNLLSADQVPDAFAFRGMCDITIRLTRDLGDEGEWHQDIRVNIPKAGLIAAPFPLPAVAHGLRLLIGDDAATVECDDLRPVTGGQATLHASVDLAELRRGGDVTPNVTIHAKDVKVDELAKQAIVMAATRRNETGHERIKTLIEQSHLAEKVDATVQVSADTTAGAQPGDIAVEVMASGFAAAPATPGTPSEAVVHLNDGWAILNASDREVDLSIGGSLVSSSGKLMTPDGKVRLTIPQREYPGVPLRSVVSAIAKELDVQTSIETTLSVFSADAASSVRQQRIERDPSGTADIAARVEIDSLGAAAQAVHGVHVEMSNLKSLSLLERGQRFWLRDLVGSITVTQAADRTGTRIRLNDIHGFAHLGSPTETPASEVSLKADFTVADGSQSNRQPTSGTFALQAKGLQFESSTLQAIANSHTTALQGLLKSYEPAGMFDLSILVDFSKPSTDATSVTGSVQPKAITFSSPLFPGKRVSLSQGTGAFEFNTQQGCFRSLSAAGSTWQGTVDGAVIFQHQPGVPKFETQISATGRGVESGTLPEDLQAVLPQAIRDVLSELSISLEPDAQFALEKTRLDYIAADGPDAQSLSTAGTLRFSGGQADVGVWLKGASGLITFKADRPRFDQPSTWMVDVDIARATAAKVALTDLRFQAKSGARDGDVLIPQITAVCHGGRLAGSASVLAATANQGDEKPPLHFEVALRAAGVHFAPVLADLKVGTASAAQVAESAQNQPSSSSPPQTVATSENDATRGILDGDATIRGTVGQPQTRGGRGSVTVGGGRILPSSGLMQLIRLSNLQFPSDEPLDLARANWFLSGPVVNFEELSVASRSVSIVGYGTMTLPSMALDLRFDSRSARRIPVVSKVIELIRDQLITTRVRGTADEPKFEVVPVPMAGRALDSMSGKQGDQVLERLRQEADARRARDND